MQDRPSGIVPAVGNWESIWGAAGLSLTPGQQVTSIVWSFPGARGLIMAHAATSLTGGNVFFNLEPQLPTGAYYTTPAANGLNHGIGTPSPFVFIWKLVTSHNDMSVPPLRFRIRAESSGATATGYVAWLQPIYR